MSKLLINCTHGNEDAEREPLAFVVGNVGSILPIKKWWCF